MAEHIKYRWDDCSVGFFCPSCGAELSADGEDGPKKCDCGLEYQLVVELKINPPRSAAPDILLKSHYDLTNKEDANG